MSATSSTATSPPTRRADRRLKFLRSASSRQASGLVAGGYLWLYHRRTMLRRFVPIEAAAGIIGKGAIAQLGERFNGIEEVVGSIPSGSTI